MPVRATKRGAARVPFRRRRCRRPDLRRLVRGPDRRARAARRPERAVLVLDRYEIGERQTSACAAPTEWLRNLGLEASIRQTFDSLLVHTPARRARPLAAAVHVLDVRLPPAVRAAVGAGRRGRVRDRQGRSSAPATTVHTDRGDVTAPLIVDALGWRRVLGPGTTSSRPRRRSRAGWRSIPAGAGDDLELWIDPRYVDAGYGWSFPARDELRIGVGSFDPHDPVKQPTLRLVEDVAARAARLPGQLDPAPDPPGDRGRRVLRRRQRRATACR